ncbi:MAG TPA: type II toxin-antitoxin system RelE/ParE family toxin [Lacipirellula sp.]
MARVDGTLPLKSRGAQGSPRDCELLGQNPQIGESCDFLAKDLRMSIVGNYIIFHRPTTGESEIVRVVHGARDWRRLF